MDLKLRLCRWCSEGVHGGGNPAGCCVDDCECPCNYKASKLVPPDPPPNDTFEEDTGTLDGQVRPEYITCILYDNGVSQYKYWCAREVSIIREFAFIDINHAVYNAERGGRLVACPECWEAICKIIKEQK